MAEPPVRLPEPSADDDEDVVWGISTAKTLWARGERRDAITWIRRAADAARVAGQGFRSTELSMYASEVEDEFERWLATAPGRASLNADAAENREVAANANTAPTSPAVRPAPPAPPAPPTPPVVIATSQVPTGREVPPTAAASAPAEPPAVATVPAAKPVIAAKPSAPVAILDPWAEEQSAPGALRSEFESTRDELPVRHEVTTPSPNVLVVEMRSRSTTHRDDDDDVMTSAPPLDEVLKRRTAPRAPPPLPPGAKQPAAPASARGGSVLATTPATPSETTSPSSRPPASAGSPPRVPAPPVLPPLTAPVIASPPVATAAPKTAPTSPVVNEPTPAKQASTGLHLDDVAAFADLPSDVRDQLTESASIEELGQDEEAAGFGAALIIHGNAVVCATIVDAPAFRASAGSLIPTKGTLPEGTKLRVVAGEGGARVAVWSQTVLDAALKSCPWILDEFKNTADRFQAVAGITMGLMGELDDATRTTITNRMTVRIVRPLETIVAQGTQLEWLAIVGGGFVDLLKGEPARVTGDVRPGDFIFPVVALRKMPVPTSVRGGPAGALLLFGDPSLAMDLFGGDKPLIDILGE